ncbi:MAG: hypothetical protein ABIP09_07525 [Gemmatimonadaceae bacterium]
MMDEHAIGMRTDERGHLTNDISRNYLSPEVKVPGVYFLRAHPEVGAAAMA